MWRWIDPEVEARVRALDLPFNRYGLDPYGVSREALVRFYSALGWLYRHYFRVRCEGLHHVPAQGTGMLIGNHSGGLPVDAGMVLASLVLDHDPPRHAHGMVEYFAQNWPFVSTIFNRLGQFTGLPQHATRLLGEGRLLMAFPEGARGTGKLFKDRYQLVRFGTGFMRLALQAQAPIIPFAFIGGEEAIPTMFHLKRLAKLVGAPYIPIPPQVLPVPLPVNCEILYGSPMQFEGKGDESDELIDSYVAQVRAAIEGLIAQGLARRGEAFQFRRSDPRQLEPQGAARPQTATAGGGR
jgi:1-acyl-sn-glycerol-3-phosphate acyltransferase